MKVKLSYPSPLLVTEEKDINFPVYRVMDTSDDGYSCEHFVRLDADGRLWEITRHRGRSLSYNLEAKELRVGSVYFSDVVLARNSWEESTAAQFNVVYVGALAYLQAFAPPPDRSAFRRACARISEKADRTDYGIMVYAQTNPCVAMSNYPTGELILFGGRKQMDPLYRALMETQF